jgi:hypothetical protein
MLRHTPDAPLEAPTTVTERAFIPQRLFKVIYKNEGKHWLFKILIIEPNAMFESVHFHAVHILLDEGAAATWLTAPRKIAPRFQRPAPEPLLSGLV